MIFTIILYVLAAGLLLLSLLKDRQKTKMALKKAWKSFENIMPQLLAILLIIGMVLAVLDQATISRLIGKDSGWLGMAIASLLGSITLMPAFIAFPLASALLKSGAGMMQIAVFVSTLMMVGIITLPVEMKYFGKKASLARNILAFVFSFGAAAIIGAVLK